MAKVEVILEKKAVKFLAKQEKKIQERILTAINTHLSKYPPDGDLKHMEGHKGLYRLRVGTYRILFRYDDDLKYCYVEVIGNRGDVY